MSQSSLEKKFVLLWNAVVAERVDVEPDAMKLEAEFQFAKHLKRKYRFDFCHELGRVAIELQGGVYSRGAHVRPEGFKKDCQKSLLARELMWTTVALTSDMITEDYINRIIDLCLSRQFISGPHCDYVVCHTSPNAFPSAYLCEGEPKVKYL
jgi:hypothetical protein